MGDCVNLDVRSTNNIRALPMDDDQPKRIIEGYAALFNEPSNRMPFIEYIKPGAFDHADLDDVLAIYSHKFEDILGRTDSGTLVLKPDEKGLFFSCVLPDTQLGHDVYTNILNGNIKGTSFRFDIGDDDSSYDADGNQVHTIYSITNVTEISLTTIPAYSQTSVKVKRSMEDFLKKGERQPMNADELIKKFQEFVKGKDPDEKSEDLIKEFQESLTGDDESENKDSAPTDDEEPTDPEPAPEEKPVDKTTRDDEELEDEPIDSDDSELRDDETKKGKGVERDMSKVLSKGANFEEGAKKDEEVRSFETYLRSHGETRDGVTTINNEAVIPTQILNLQKEKSAPNMLKNYVNRQMVSAPKGTLPILKKASAGLVTKEELAENPELAMSITPVDYSVKTYAGGLPISQEMIDDAAVNISSIAGAYVQDVSDITEQRKIGEALQTATVSVDVKTADDLKDAFNVKVPAGYDKSFVLGQSFYNEIDKMKDANGRYLFQDSLTIPSGVALFGKAVYVVDDGIIGAKGEINGWVGDLKSFILDAVKKEVTVRWQDNDLYAQKLATYLRFDVQKAIDEAGVMLKYKGTVTAAESTTTPKS